LILFLLFLVFFASFVHASQTFTVLPGNKQNVNVSLSKGDFVNGTVSVSGGSGIGVNFNVSDPSGRELLSQNYVTFTNFSFSASSSGTYTLTFDNSFCSCTTGKTVTLDYDVNNSTQSNAEVLSAAGLSLAIAIVLASVVLTIVLGVIIKIGSRRELNN